LLEAIQLLCSLLDKIDTILLACQSNRATTDGDSIAAPISAED
jgi:hypothetical protein